MSTMTALVTGANRGIGFEVCSQLARLGMEVILTGRDADSVAAAVRELRNGGLQIVGEVLDVGPRHPSSTAPPASNSRAGASTSS